MKQFEIQKMLLCWIQCNFLLREILAINFNHKKVNLKMQQEITSCLMGMKERQGVCDQSAEAIYTRILRGMLLAWDFPSPKSQRSENNTKDEQ